MRQHRPQKSVEWCATPKPEQDDSFRVKLRTDMVQVVRDQHDMLQSWAAQWERRSMAQMDEMKSIIIELRDDVKALKETTASRKDKKSNYMSSRIADLEKFGSTLVAGAEQDKSGDRLLGGAPGRPGALSLDASDPDAAPLPTRSGRGPLSPSGQSGISGRNSTLGIADNVRKAADLVQEDPAAAFWDVLTESFPQLKKSAACNMLGRVVIWLYTAEDQEPERKGPLAAFAGHPAFEAVCMIVILLNTWSIFLSANDGMRNLSDNDGSLFMVINSCFTCFYVFEILVKVCVHRAYFFINHERVWNIFDMCLVMGGMMELMVGLFGEGSSSLNPAFMRCMRLLKLAKILRVVRVMRFFSELRLMLKCVVGSFISLFWASVMLLCFNLLFAIFFVQQITNYLIDNSSEIPAEYREDAVLYYGSVQTAMLSLFKGISGGNDWDTYFPVVEVTGWLNATVFILYILLVWISLTNIITSIFVEKALEFAQPGQDDLIMERHALDRQTAIELKQLFHKNDKDESGAISWDEFIACLQDKTLTDYMCFRGMDVKDAQAFFRMLSSVMPNGEVDIKTIIGGLISLKGGASNIDMLLLSCELQSIHHTQEDVMHELAAQRRLILESGIKLTQIQAQAADMSEL